MEQHCKFCERVVVDSEGQKTEDYGTLRYGKHYICTHCIKSFEFSIGG